MALFLTPDGQNAQNCICHTAGTGGFDVNPPRHERDAGRGKGELPLLVVVSHILRATTHKGINVGRLVVDSAG